MPICYCGYDYSHNTGDTMRTVKASEFKAKCLKIMDEVAATGEPVVITKYGVPVAQLVPAMQKPKTLFGALKGSILYMGDVTSPIHVEWNAEIE